MDIIFLPTSAFNPDFRESDVVDMQSSLTIGKVVRLGEKPSEVFELYDPFSRQIGVFADRDALDKFMMANLEASRSLAERKKQLEKYAESGKNPRHHRPGRDR